jgi:hypothetical protein
MNTPLPLQDLVADIVHKHTSARLELEPLPSGVCFLWVWLGGRNFVLEFDPKLGAGVSENTSETPHFNAGHDRAFDSLEEAVNDFKRLLRQTDSTLTPAALAA